MKTRPNAFLDERRRSVSVLVVSVLRQLRSVRLEVSRRIRRRCCCHDRNDEEKWRSELVDSSSRNRLPSSRSVRLDQGERPSRSEESSVDDHRRDLFRLFVAGLFAKWLQHFLHASLLFAMRGAIPRGISSWNSRWNRRETFGEVRRRRRRVECWWINSFESLVSVSDMDKQMF